MLFYHLKREKFTQPKYRIYTHQTLAVQGSTLYNDSILSTTTIKQEEEISNYFCLVNFI